MKHSSERKESQVSISTRFETFAWFAARKSAFALDENVSSRDEVLCSRSNVFSLEEISGFESAAMLSIATLQVLMDVAIPARWGIVSRQNS